MLKNFFLLNRLVVELNISLKGYRILSVFTQDKDVFILECRKDNDTVFAVISVNPQFPYITLRNKYHRAKKNVVEIIREYLPSIINEISIAVIDRIIKFQLDTGVMYFFIRGNRTNVIISSAEGSSGFKKLEPQSLESFLLEFSKNRFTFQFVNFSITQDVDSLKDCKTRYPFLGKEILNEAGSRSGMSLSANINSVIDDIKNNNPAVYKKHEDAALGFDGFITFRDWTPEYFDNIFDAVNDFIYSKHSSERFLYNKQNIISALEKDLAREASRINNLKSRIDSGSKEEEYKRTADLLMINANNIKKGLDEIIAEDIYNSNIPVKIKIDTSLSPHKNAEKYYEKSRSERINYKKSKELYEAALKKYNRLRSELNKVTAAYSPGELKNMDINKYPSPGNEKDDIKSKFRQYLIDGKYRLYVGRDSEKNDLLTTRFAKQNDYWFHARSVSGSHVILRVDNAKETVPKPVLKKAASVAAFHSKAKTSSLAPVSYTLKKYVVKKKGMEPGKVSLLKEEVLLVKPEIPAGCEFISSE